MTATMQAKAFFDRVARRAMRLYERLHYDLVLARQGYGTPVAKETWDAEYGKSHSEWTYFDTPSELGRYALIASYVHHLHGSPAILEVGCGHGSLVELLARFGFQNFLGIDLSPAAIQRAEALGIPGASFAAADLESFEPPGRYDTIVFNETLYYAKQPTQTLLRYARSLNPNGTLIVSMHRSGNHAVIWRNLFERFDLRYSTLIQNQAEQAWDVRVLEPKPAP